MASKKSKNTGLVITMLVVSIVGGALLGVYVVDTPAAARVPQDLRREKPVVKTTQVPGRLVPRVQKDGRVTFQLENVKVPAGQDERVFLINDLLKQLHDHGLGDSNARALGVDVHDRIAYIDFNSAFEKTYGTMDEGTVLNGILSTMGQFSNIDKVKFEINGKSMETLGNVDLTEAQDVIRPGQKLEDSGDAG